MINDLPKTAKKENRLDYIRQRLRQHGFVNVDDLAAELEVSRMTIHRDLNDLQELGLLRKTRGGASARRSVQFESDFGYRSVMAMPEKRRIAKVAADLIHDGDVLLIDDSTSCLELVPYLKKMQGLTVITNFMNLIEELVPINGINLISLGGQYTEKYRTFMGIVTEDNLSRLRADTVFMSISSIKGVALFHQEQYLATLKRKMLSCAERKVLLVDCTKIDSAAIHYVCDISAFTHVITDENADEKFVTRARREGVEVIIAGS